MQGASFFRQLPIVDKRARLCKAVRKRRFALGGVRRATAESLRASDWMRGRAGPGSGGWSFIHSGCVGLVRDKPKILVCSAGGGRKYALKYKLTALLHVGIECFDFAPVVCNGANAFNAVLGRVFRDHVFPLKVNRYLYFATNRIATSFALGSGQRDAVSFASDPTIAVLCPMIYAPFVRNATSGAFNAASHSFNGSFVWFSNGVFGNAESTASVGEMNFSHDFPCGPWNPRRGGCDLLPWLIITRNARKCQHFLGSQKMTFDQAFDRLLGHEGGYSNHPSDTGGETMWGVTIAVARQQGYTGLMRELPRETAKAIYRRMYWDAIRADELPDRINFVVFDAAVNSGVSQSVVWLQRALKVNDDGVIGPQTIKAARESIDPLLPARMLAHRLRFVSALPTWPAFGRGWANRIATNILDC